jgi:hypothetical protein
MQPQPVVQYAVNAPVQKKKGHGTAITLGVLAAVVLLIAGFFIYKSATAPKPQDIVNKFVDSINTMDINTAVSCMDPKYELIIKGVSGLMSKVAGVDSSELLNSIPVLAEMQGSYGGVGKFKLNIVRVISENINGDNATVRVEMKFENADGTSENEEGTIYLKNFSGKGWRITNFR